MENKSIKEFVATSISQIRKGVVDFNKENEFYRAEMPKEIEFDVALLINKNGIELISNLDVGQQEVTRIKFKVNPKAVRLD